VESEVRKRAQLETEQQRMADILRYMQTLGAATGVAPPASLFTPPRTPHVASSLLPVVLAKFSS